MVTARLLDGSDLDVVTLGQGPPVLLTVRTAVTHGETAEQMRAWGADPALGHTLATALAGAGFHVIAADYEGHLAGHPQPLTLTAGTVASDLLAIADAARVDRFAYYGYSWLALAGLQLALRTDRLTALAMGGYPPLRGPYAAMLTVTRAAHRMATARAAAGATARAATPAGPTEARPEAGKPPPEPGDWDSAEVTQTPEQTQQYLTLYESLQDFDEAAALERLTVARLAFAGADDNIAYGAAWDHAFVAIAQGLQRSRDELVWRGWSVEVVPDADHLRAMQAGVVLPILVPWLTGVLRPTVSPEAPTATAP